MGLDRQPRGPWAWVLFPVAGEDGRGSRAPLALPVLWWGGAQALALRKLA